jgi:hypothetical protein
MAKHYETVGETGYDGLIVAASPAANAFTITLRKGVATLKRGQVLVLSGGTAGDGKFVALGATPVTNETLTPNAVLTDDVTITAAEDVVTTAYRTGHFARNLLIGTVTPEVEEQLRIEGILLSDAIA